MDRADVALAISVLALGLSAVSLGWTIFKELGLRPRVRVTCQVATFVSPDRECKKIMVTALNLGPGQLLISGLALRNSWWARVLGQAKWFGLAPEFESPIATPLPATLAVGEKATIIVAYDERCFLSSRVARAGVSDTFSRTHWASRSDLERSRDLWRKDFARAL